MPSLWPYCAALVACLAALFGAYVLLVWSAVLLAQHLTLKGCP